MFRPGSLCHSIGLYCVAFVGLPRAAFLVVVVGLLSLSGCANQGVTRSVQGKSVSGQLQLKQRQVAYSDSFITDRPSAASGLGAAAEGQFHTPQFIERGKLNVGNGSLSYQGREYSFRIAGLGAAGIGTAEIEAKGEVYGLENLRELSGSYTGANYRAAQNTVGGLLLTNEKGVIIRIAALEKVPLFVVGDAVIVKLNQ
jgi:hypothetical protein